MVRLCLAVAIRFLRDTIAIRMAVDLRQAVAIRMTVRVPIRVPIRMAVRMAVRVTVCCDTIFICVCICRCRHAVPIRVSVLRKFLRALAPRLRKGEDQEGCLKGQQHEREDCRRGVHVQLEAGRLERCRERLGGEVRADGRSDAEADGESNADVCDCFCAIRRSGDVGQDGAMGKGDVSALDEAAVRIE